LTTGLSDLQSTPKDPATLKTYIERLKMLGAKQQDWIVRMVRQRAGEAVEKEVRNALA